MASIPEEVIRTEWKKADTDNSGTLDFKEIVSLLKKLNLKLDKKVLRKVFDEVDADKGGDLDFDEFTVFLSKLNTRPEIVEIFSEATNKADKFTPQEFVDWIKTSQKETWTLEQAEKFISTVEKQGEKNLTIRGFLAYLGDKDDINGIMNPAHKKVYQDMTQPLAHYWIDSSHNTYLLGDQLRGESSKQAYINALLKGCRCVELDCWDNDKDLNMPIIYHGHTLTSKITFLEVVETVRDYGFKTSEYPVILSLEVHCKLEGQKAMAKILTDVLGKADMFVPPFHKSGKWPSPSELKGKVLLKGKVKNFVDEGKEDLDKKADPKAKKKKLPVIAEELSDLTHLKAVGFKDWSASKKNKPYEMSSFEETKVEKFIKKEPVQFADYNSHHLSRIYPKGLRVDSSNYDPFPAWNHGAQIVALNYQTGSEPLWYNNGRFLDNGNSGYLLKPEILRNPNPKTWNPSDKKMKPAKKLTIQVRSCFRLPKTEGKEKSEKGDTIDPFIKVSINGVVADVQSQKTKTVKDNGWNPTYDSTMTFTLAAPEYACVLFQVIDAETIGKDLFVAYYTARVTSLREGWRTIPLRDSQGGWYTQATILARVTME